MENKSNENTNSHLKGKLLVSAPFLDDIFKRAVILITENNEEGSVGFILNKITEFSLHEIIEEFPVFDAKVYLGGPVQQEALNFIHKAGDILEGSFQICEGVFWGGNFEHLKILIENNAVDPDDFKFFLGYSGWGNGQLENELKIKSWYVNVHSNDYIFCHNSGNLWSKVLRSMGNEYTVISTFPEDPSLN